MKRLFQITFLIILSIYFFPLMPESGGNLAKYPPEEKDITITTSKDGYPKITPEEINLLTGKYYRLRIPVSYTHLTLPTKA